MAQPTKTNYQPVYRHRLIAGNYRVSYQAAAGAHKPGIPLDDLTDLVNLTKISGPVSSPWLVVTSEFDFKSNWHEYNPIQTTTPEGEQK